MLKDDAAKPISRKEMAEENYGNARYKTASDIVLSIVLIFLSVVIGGFGLFMVTKSWLNLPYIFLGILIWGGACIGIRRLFWKWSNA